MYVPRIYQEYVDCSTESHIKARSNLLNKDAKHIAKKSKENDGDITVFPVDSYVLAEPLNYFTVRK